MYAAMKPYASRPRVPPRDARPAPEARRFPGRGVAPLAAFIILFALYAATACRTVGPGDSGELTAVLSSWGVAHAPGYPLYSLIGNLVSLLPLPGEPALALNLLSSLFAALAAAVLAAAVIEATGSGAAAFVAALALGTSRVYWQYALVAEVFALNALFGATLLYLLARFLRGLRERAPVAWPLPAAGLVASTAITHHQTLVIVLFPVALVFAVALLRAHPSGAPRAVPRGAIVAATVAAIAGLLPLLYIPLAARGNPVLSWDDPTTTGSLIRLVQRQDFGPGTLMSPSIVAGSVLARGESVSPLGGRHFWLFLAELPRDFGWVFVLFPLVGVVWAALRRRLLALLFAGLAAMLVLFFLRVNSPVLPLYQGITERFYILPHVFVAFCGGWGIAWIGGSISGRGSRLGWLFHGTVAALTGIAMIFVNGPHATMRNNTFTRDFGVNLIAGMPRDAIVLSMGDLYHNAFYYQQVCLGKRPDLEFVDQQKLTYRWYVDQVRRRGRMLLPPGMRAYDADSATHVKAWLDLNLRQAGRPVVAVGVRDQSWRSGYRMVPMGLWSRFRPLGDTPPPAAHAALFRDIVRSWTLASLEHRHDDRSWEAAERPVYSRALGLLAGTSDLARDLAAGRAEVELGPEAAALLARAEEIAGGDRAVARAAHLAIYHRALLERTIDFTPVGGRARMVKKVIALAERAVRNDPASLPALKTLAGLMRADSAAYDARRELELRALILDRAPGDVQEVAAYVQLAIGLMSDSAAGGAALRAALIRRERALLDRLDLALRAGDDPSLRQQRIQWRENLRRTETLRR